MDKIIIKNMRFFAYHGVLDKEKANGQDFIIDAELSLDLKKPGNTDDLNDTADYSTVYGIIRNITENNKFRLIEKLADSIAREILSRFKEIVKIIIQVRKPDAPIADARKSGGFDYVAVEVTRFANDK
jgi:7,8-dihydroneopterin aldolase/epimerase/oxygenase